MQPEAHVAWHIGSLDWVFTRAVSSSHYAPPRQPKCLITFPSSFRCLRILNDYDHAISPLVHLWAQDFVNRNSKHRTPPIDEFLDPRKRTQVI